MKLKDEFLKVSPVRAARSVEDRRVRNPLISPGGFKNFMRLKQHPHAPIWNFETGDRIENPDLADIRDFAEKLQELRPVWTDRPPDSTVKWVRRRRPVVSAFQRNIPENYDIQKDWAAIPTTNRKTVAAKIETLVPYDADVSRLIVYDTSGTSGHPMAVPQHPAALGKVLPMLEFVMARYGVSPRFFDDMTACFNVGAQIFSVVFPTVLSVWNQAGFAKINLQPDVWRADGDVQLFFDAAAPLFLTGDPVGFYEMQRRGIRARPQMLFTTAVSLPAGLKKSLQTNYECPVVDWYSATEVGPVGYVCPREQGFHLLAHDLYVEIVDPEGAPLPPGQLGEITVTGGRNPYLPLLRYRTGDFARLDVRACPCGDPTPRLVDLQGRSPVLFRGAGNRLVNPIDVGRILRAETHARHRLVQRADGSCDLTLTPVLPGQSVDTERIRNALELLFGGRVPMRLHLEAADAVVSEETRAAYHSEIPFVSVFTEPVSHPMLTPHGTIEQGDSKRFRQEEGDRIQPTGSDAGKTSRPRGGSRRP